MTLPRTTAPIPMEIARTARVAGRQEWMRSKSELIRNAHGTAPPDPRAIALIHATKITTPMSGPRSM
jgi:hypothetical protein